MLRNEYQYSTSPYKLDPEYNQPRTKTKKRNKIRVVENLPRQKVEVSKEQKMKKLKLTLVVIAIFGLLLTISYRNSQINEEFNQMQSLKKELSSLQKENEQLKVGIENGLNYTTIEKIAKEKLGMQKITNKQIIYVSLPKKDYVESSSEKVIINNQKNWFEQFVDKVFNR